MIARLSADSDQMREEISEQMQTIADLRAQMHENKTQANSKLQQQMA